MSWSDDFHGSDKTRGLLVAKVGAEVGITMGDGGDGAHGRRLGRPMKSTGVCLEEA